MLEPTQLLLGLGCLTPREDPDYLPAVLLQDWV